MRLIIFLLTAALAQTHATGVAQSLTFSGKDVPLKQVFTVIKKQTGYVVFYNRHILSQTRPVSISVRDMPIRDFLRMVLKDQPLDFVIEDKTISLSAQKNKKELPALPDASGVEASPVKIQVLDSTGRPLPGATISISGKAGEPGNSSARNRNGKVAGVTDADGIFTADVQEGDLLRVSYVGYETRTVPVTAAMLFSDKRFVVVLRSSVTDMENVHVIVNTGYQSLPKERATGSFGVISREQLDRPATNIAQRLIGTTAGVQATLDPAGNPSFEIRGQTTLNIDGESNVPLVIVDGFPIQGDFSTINPNDVESVTILKDAAAASIWGARSANGVIVVTTRQGKKGAPVNVRFSGFTTIAARLDLDYVNPLASSSETVDYEKMAFGNWGGYSNPGSLDYYFVQWSPATIALNEHLLGFLTKDQLDRQLDQYRNLSNKKQISDELLTNPVIQQYSLSVSGGTPKTSNYLSLLFEDAKTNFRGTDQKKINLTYRASTDLFKWLELSVTGQSNYQRYNNNGVTLEDIRNISPYEMLRNEDGSLTNISRYYTPVIDRHVPTGLFPYADWGYNPIQEIQNRELSSEVFNSRLQAGLRFRVLNGLTFESWMQYELGTLTNKGYYKENSFLVRDLVNISSTWDRSTDAITPNLPTGGFLDLERSREESYQFRNQVLFARKIAEKNELNFIGGAEVRNKVVEYFGQPRTYGYNDETLSVGAFPNGTGDLVSIPDWMGSDQYFSNYNSFSYRTDRYFSLYGNAAYTYNDKYTLSGSVRTDASNLITDDPAYRYAPFWSAGVSWQVEKESFMNKVSWVDKLNVRATFGYNGNVDRSTSFRPLIGFNLFPNAYTGDRTARVYSFGNPTLRWEKTGTFNFGVDYSLLEGKLNGRLDLYQKSGKDLIADMSIPAVNGTIQQRFNNAEMSNKGIELEIGTSRNIKGKDITWKGALNFSYNRNRVTRLFIANYEAYSMISAGSYAYVEGENSSSLWRYRYAGVKDGQPMVYGPQGDLYNFTAFITGDGRTFLENMGPSVAPYTLGFLGTFKVYDFSLSYIVTGKFGHVFQRTGFNYPPSWTTRVLPNNKISEVLNGDPSRIAPLPQNPLEPRFYFWDRFTGNLNYLIESASHIRMQEIALSYNLPARIVNSARMRNLQVFAQGNDLFTSVANNAGEDPEYPIGTLKPQPRLTFGVKCEF